MNIGELYELVIFRLTDACFEDAIGMYLGSPRCGYDCFLINGQVKSIWFCVMESQKRLA